MVQYRYAKQLDGSIADALEIAGKELETSEFMCLGCERQLIAKVNGTKRQPHFSHHPGTTCSPETYLHRLGKQVFAQVFNECLATGKPFEIELQRPLVCRRFESCIGSPCVLDEMKPKTYDLTTYFNSVITEQRDGQFIPDLLLTSDSNPSNKAYVEIAVTHFLSEQKENSSERIIEIPLETEDDLEKIRSRRLTEKIARFKNFSIESQSLVDADCRCANRPCFAFLVYDSGKCVLDKSTLADLVSKRNKLGEKVEYFRIMVPKDDEYDDFMPSPSQIFIDAVHQAQEQGFPLKNCYLCRYHGNNFAGDEKKPIFCKYHKKSFTSNEAVTCKIFRRQETYAPRA